MTSIREKARRNNLTQADIDFFERNKGSVPLCCIHVWLVNPRTYERYEEPRYKCDQLKRAIPFKKFEKFCLKCQKEIEECLKRGVENECP